MQVGGVAEHWRIEWRETPEPVCITEWNCSCASFAHAQVGRADLVRTRNGQADDVLAIASIYDDGQLPDRKPDQAVLPAWPEETADYEGKLGEEELSKVIRSRKLLRLIELRDYDHDGRTTEFVLPVGGVGCAFHGFAAVGISRSKPKLHVLGTAKHPDTALVLAGAGWRTLGSSSRGRYVDVECEFRGAETQIEVELWTDKAGIHRKRFEYACPRKPGRVLSTVED